MFSTLGNQLSAVAASTKEAKEDWAGIKDDLQDILRLIEDFKLSIEIQSNEEVMADNSTIVPCDEKRISGFSSESSTPQTRILKCATSSFIGNLGHKDCASCLDNYNGVLHPTQDQLLLRFWDAAEDVCRHWPESASSPPSVTIGTSAKVINTQSAHFTIAPAFHLLFGQVDLSTPPLDFPPLTAVYATDTRTRDGAGWRCSTTAM
jgi:hypothetical protein